MGIPIAISDVSMWYSLKSQQKDIVSAERIIRIYFQCENLKIKNNRTTYFIKVRKLPV